MTNLTEAKLTHADMQEAASEAVSDAWTKADELLSEAQNDTTDSDELLRRLIIVVNRLCSGVKMMQIAARADASSGVDTLLDDADGYHPLQPMNTNPKEGDMTELKTFRRMKGWIAFDDDGDSPEVEIVCDDCLNLHAGRYDGPCYPMMPSRKRYKTQGGYERAMKAAFLCQRCARELSIEAE